MKENKNTAVLKIFVVFAFLLMIAVNILANALPLNGITSGAVSDAYPNLFTPAALTFSIWGLIYILLALFVLYALGVFKGKSGYRPKLICSTGVAFILSCFANAAWLFSWHYRIMPLSLALIAALYLLIMIIYIKLRRAETGLKEKVFLRLPISVYFGWLTVAVIANIATFLVSIGFKVFGVPEDVWTAALLAIGTAAGVFTTLKYKDAAYGLVFVWAFAGILIKHISPEGFALRYPLMVYAAAAALALMGAAVVIAAVKALRKKEA